MVIKYYLSNIIVINYNGNILIWNLKQITNNIISQTNNNNCININYTQLNIVNAYAINDTIINMDWCNDYLKYFVTISANGFKIMVYC